MYKTELIGINFLQPGEQQVRKEFDPVLLEELRNSIARYGLLQPLVVQASTKDQGVFNIIAGERRYRACSELGFKNIICSVLPPDVDAITEMCLIENVQRADLNPIEEAKAYAVMLDKGYTQNDIAQRVSKSRSYIANIVRILQLPENLQAKLESGALSVGHAHLLLQSDAPEQLAAVILEQGLSVHDARKHVKLNQNNLSEDNFSADSNLQAKTRSQPKQNQIIKGEFNQSELKELEEQITRLTHMDAVLHPTNGTLTLKYSNLGELDLLLEKLSRY